MARQPSPSAADLRVLDPDGAFRERLTADHKALGALSDSHDLAPLLPIVHRLAGAAGTFGYGGLGEVAIELDERFRDGAPVTAAHLTRLLAALEQALGVPTRSA